MQPDELAWAGSIVASRLRAAAPQICAQHGARLNRMEWVHGAGLPLVWVCFEQGSIKQTFSFEARSEALLEKKLVELALVVEGHAAHAAESALSKMRED